MNHGCWLPSSTEKLWNHGCLSPNDSRWLRIENGGCSLLPPNSTENQHRCSSLVLVVPRLSSTEFWDGSWLLLPNSTDMGVEDCPKIPLRPNPLKVVGIGNDYYYYPTIPLRGWITSVHANPAASKIYWELVVVVFITHYLPNSSENGGCCLYPRIPPLILVIGFSTLVTVLWVAAYQWPPAASYPHTSKSGFSNPFTYSTVYVCIMYTVQVNLY